MGTFAHLPQVVLKLPLALLLGATIGLERRLRGHPAGLHTNALVALGAASYVVINSLGINDSSPTRVAGQVVTGVGFLCAGLIWHEGGTVRGLNTAATVWCSSAVGVLAGMGFGEVAVLVASMVLGSNIALHYLEHRVFASDDPRTPL